MHKYLFPLLLALPLSAQALDQESLYGTWHYADNSPVQSSINMRELDGSQRASQQCGNFETLTFAEATGSEIAEDLAEQMPSVLAFSNEQPFVDYADFSKRAATWFKPNQNYQVATWNCGEVGGNYYFLDNKRGVATSAGVNADDTFVVEIGR